MISVSIFINSYNPELSSTLLEAAHSAAHETTEAPGGGGPAAHCRWRGDLRARSGVQSDPAGNQVLDLGHCTCSNYLLGKQVHKGLTTQLHEAPIAGAGSEDRSCPISKFSTGFLQEAKFISTLLPTRQTHGGMEPNTGNEQPVKH